MNHLPPPPQILAQQPLALNDPVIVKLTVTITKGQKFGLTTHFFDKMASKWTSQRMELEINNLLSYPLFASLNYKQILRQSGRLYSTKK
jgi:hypothetical protein